jgi:perosamine synthetase
MKIVPLCEPQIGAHEQRWMQRCLESGFVSSAGALIDEFEQRFAGRVGVKFAVAVNSGTAALHLALRSVGVNRDSCVAVPDLTFVASVNPVLYLGASPLLVDVDAQGWCLNLELLEEACRTRKVDAVVPVHLYGCSVDMERLMQLSDRYGFKVVEDATEALGTLRDGRQVGSFGHVGCFSFNGNKMMTTGAGGMVVTDDRALAEKIRFWVNQARAPGDKYVHPEMGYNYRLPNLNAAMGLAQLEQLDQFFAAKRAIASGYQRGLAAIEGLTLHPEGSCENNCFWLYSLLMPSGAAREAALLRLHAHGIQARGFFEPLHTHPYLAQADQLKEAGWVSSDLAARGINLPSSVGLSAEAQQRVIQLLTQV